MVFPLMNLSLKSGITNARGDIMFMSARQARRWIIENVPEPEPSDRECHTKLGYFKRHRYRRGRRHTEFQELARLRKLRGGE